MANSPIIEVLIADRHPLFRLGICACLDRESDIQVIGEAATGEVALDLIRELRPTVALVNIEIPRKQGVDLARQVTGEYLETSIILVADYPRKELARRASRSGAAGFCNKDIEAPQLIDMIRRIAKRLRTIDMEGRSKGCCLEGAQEAPEQKEVQDSVELLTPREEEILGFIAEGMSNKQIASTLKISIQTVKNHNHAIYRKLDVQDRTQAMLYAARQGWFQL